jgi:hypothetical protein
MIAKPLIMVPAALLVGGAAVFGVATAAQSHETTQDSPAPVTTQQAPATPAAPTTPAILAPAPASAVGPAAKTYHMNKHEARGRAIGRHYENLYR